MQPTVHPSLYTSLAIAALVLWRMYSRVRRAIGRQKLSPVRPWLTVTVFPLLFAFIAFGAAMANQPGALVALLAGTLLGLALGVIGHRLTTFEATPAGLFYTPNAHLGTALSLLMAGRIVWRYLQLSVTVDTSAGTGPGFVSSPLTLLIFGTLASYYVTYAIGLLNWRRRTSRADRPAPAPIAPGDDGRIG